jgi:hypothetical protein
MAGVASAGSAPRAGAVSAVVADRVATDDAKIVVMDHQTRRPTSSALRYLRTLDPDVVSRIEDVD